MLYLCVPRLFEELQIAHGDGSFTRRLAQLAKIDVLILDDWGLREPSERARGDLLEVLDDHVGAAAHQAHKITLKDESMRKRGAADAISKPAS